jgi:hypothetical protein
MNGEHKNVLYIIMLVIAVVFMPKIREGTSRVDKKIASGGSPFGEKLSITKQSLEKLFSKHSKTE